MIGFEKIRSWTDVSVSSAWRSMTKFLQIHVMLLLSSFVLAHIRVYKAVGATHLYLHPHTNSSFCLTEIHVWAAYVYFSRCCLLDGHGHTRGRHNVYKEGQKHTTHGWKTRISNTVLPSPPFPHTAQRTPTHTTRQTTITTHNHSQRSSSILKLYSFQST